jgi:hypothetical protein
MRRFACAAPRELLYALCTTVILLVVLDLLFDLYLSGFGFDFGDDYE